MTTPAQGGGILFNFRNVFILLGILITTIGIIYFATEFIDRLSDYARVMSLLLLTVIFIAVGRHFENEPDAGELVSRGPFRWLRVTSALYLLALVSTFTGVMVFLGIDDLPPLARAGTTLVLGLGLIVFAARAVGRRSTNRGFENGETDASSTNEPPQ